MGLTVVAPQAAMVMTNMGAMAKAEKALPARLANNPASGSRSPLVYIEEKSQPTSCMSSKPSSVLILMVPDVGKYVRIAIYRGRAGQAMTMTWSLVTLAAPVSG